MLEAELQSKILNLHFNDKKSIRQISIIVGVDRKNIQLEKLKSSRTS